MSIFDILLKLILKGFLTKKVYDLASLWEGVELFSRKQGRISPRLKFQIQKWNCVTNFQKFFLSNKQDYSCQRQVLTRFFGNTTDQHDRSCFCFIEARAKKKDIWNLLVVHSGSENLCESDQTLVKIVNGDCELKYFC